MPPDPTVHVVEDPHDSLELAQLVAGLADRTGGRAVCRPTPGPGTSTQLAADLLVALGKRFDALRFERQHPRAWPLVELWMAAEEVRHLFVLRGHLLHPDRCRELTALGHRSGINIWLIGPPRSRPQQAPQGRRRPHRWTAETFTAHWANTTSTDEPDLDDAATFPEVPAEDFPTFRATCRRLLDTAGFEQVDHAYRQSMDDTDLWLRPWDPRGRRTAPPPLTLDDLASHLQNLIIASTGNADAVTRLRGAQASCFRAGWLLGFDPVIVNPKDGQVPLGPDLDRTVASRLRRLCTPHSVAAMTLFLATHLHSEALSHLDIADIGDDGATVTISGGQRFRIPDHAASLVRVQLLARREAGAVDSDPLFVRSGTAERSAAAALRNTLRSIGAKTGISVSVHDSMASPNDAKAWLRARGIDLTLLKAAPGLTA